MIEVPDFGFGGLCESVVEDIVRFIVRRIVVCVKYLDCSCLVGGQGFVTRKSFGGFGKWKLVEYLACEIWWQ